MEAQLNDAEAQRAELIEVSTYRYVKKGPQLLDRTDNLRWIYRPTCICDESTYQMHPKPEKQLNDTEAQRAELIELFYGYLS